MGIAVLFNVAVTVDGDTLTQRARSVTVNESAEELNVTTFGGDGYSQFTQGLKTGEISVEFFQDFTTNQTHDILYPLWVDGSAFTLRIGPDGDSGSGTNPVWVGEVQIYTYNFLTGEVGQASTNTVTFRLTSAPTLNTT